MDDKWSYDMYHEGDLSGVKYPTKPGSQDLEWFRLNLPGLPDVFFEQLAKVESGEITKKDVKNMHKKYVKKHKGCLSEVGKFS